MRGGPPETLRRAMPRATGALARKIHSGLRPAEAVLACLCALSALACVATGCWSICQGWPDARQIALDGAQAKEAMALAAAAGFAWCGLGAPAFILAFIPLADALARVAPRTLRWAARSERGLLGQTIEDGSQASDSPPRL